MKTAFLAPLIVQVVTDDLYVLHDDFGVYSTVLGREHWVHRGKPTDFSSVPRWPFAYWLTGGKAKWEAVIHDDLCDRPDMVDRETADRVFIELMGVSAQFTLDDQISKQLIALEAKRYDGVRLNGDGTVTITKHPQPRWRRRAMGGGVRLGAAWDDLRRAIRDDPTDQPRKGT